MFNLIYLNPANKNIFYIENLNRKRNPKEIIQDDFSINNIILKNRRVSLTFLITLNREVTQ